MFDGCMGCVLFVYCAYLGAQMRGLCALCPYHIKLRSVHSIFASTCRRRVRVQKTGFQPRARFQRACLIRIQPRQQRLRKQSSKKVPLCQATTTEVDVAVIGGGIIGLCVALELLCHASKPSVALVERQEPCAGATGAGMICLLTALARMAITFFSASMHFFSLWQLQRSA